MLERGFGEGREEKGTNKAFKNFRGRAEERDRAEGGAEVKGLAGFRDREDEGVFPKGREISVREREVKEVSEIGDCFRT